MTDHDPLCPARRENWDDGSVWASPSPCQCDEYARVRADERGQGYEGTSAKDWARLAREANMACIAVMDERDAARAEVAALRERIAQEIELGCNHAMENGRPVACGKCLRCARIARGGESE